MASKGSSGSSKPQKGRNDTRPNGKAWKRSWGPSGPSKEVSDLAQTQSSNSKRRREK